MAVSMCVDTEAECNKSVNCPYKYDDDTITLGHVQVDHFQAFVERGQSTEIHRRFYVRPTGELLIFRKPNKLQEMAMVLIREAVRDALEDLGIGEDAFEWVGNMVCRMGSRMKECTDGLRPTARESPPFKACNREGEAFPSVVFEVAYANESIALLEEILDAWTNDATDVRLALALKIWPTAHKVSFLIKQRGCPCKQVDYQISKLDEVGVPDGVEVPLTSIWDWMFIPQGMAEQKVTLPLKAIYRVLLMSNRTPSR
jgi:hypothetical protein